MRPRRLGASLLVALAITTLVTACSKSSDTAGGSTSLPGTTPDATAPAKPVPAELPEVLARVNDAEISRSEFERALQSLEGRRGPIPAAERDMVLRQLLDEVIAYRLLVQESEKRNVVVSDGEVQSQIDRIRQQFPTEDGFARALAQQKVTLEELRADTKRQLVVQKLLEQEIGPKLAATPDQVSAFYKENPQMFQKPEQVRASHILIRVTPDADAAAKKAARTKAETVLKSAKSGKDFAALAKEFSEDPGSAVNGGDLGSFAQGQMVGPFNDAAFTLAPGTISDIVETEFGYHIIKVIEKQPAGTVALEEARSQIERHLQGVNQQRETQTFVQALRGKGKVDILI